MLGQHRRRSAGTAKGPFNVHVENLVPYLVGQAVEIAEIDPVGYAGIIDQYVEATELPRGSARSCRAPEYRSGHRLEPRALSLRSVPARRQALGLLSMIYDS